jgi:hypothetical protein
MRVGQGNTASGCRNRSRRPLGWTPKKSPPKSRLTRLPDKFGTSPEYVRLFDLPGTILESMWYFALATA